MSAQKIKTTPVERRDWNVYWGRAKELYASMKTNMVEERLNAAVIDAVQCAISIGDAYTVSKLGLRCTSDSHADTAILFTQAAHPQNVNQQTHHLTNILSIKSHVEYGPSRVRPHDAQRITQDVERLYTWVAAQLRGMT